MKLSPKIPRQRKNYFLSSNLIKSLEELSARLGYSETDLVTIALQNLIKENE